MGSPVPPRFNPIRIVTEATRLLVRSRRPLLLYALTVHAVAALALLPFAIWILAEALSLARTAAVLNYDIASLALSLDGLLLGFLWALAFAMLGTLVLAGYALIPAAVRAGQGVALSPLLRRLRGLAPLVPGRGVLWFALWAALLAPLFTTLATAFAAVLLAPFGGGPIEAWIPDEMKEIAWVVPAGVLLTALGYALYVRWCLAIHCMAIERVRLTAAFGRSAALVRGRFWRVALLLSLHHMTAALFVGLVSLALGAVDWFAVRSVSEESPHFSAVVALLMVLNALALGAATAMALARGMALGSILHERLAGPAPDLDLEPATAAPRPPSRLRRALAIPLILLALAVATGLTLPQVDEELGALDRAVVVMAHRGFSGVAPENTLAAIEAAIAAGADYVEIDVQQSADGALVVIHDKSLSRTAGVKRDVGDLTLAELRELDVGSWFDAGFRGERIPTLAESLGTARGRIRLNIEMKVYGKERDFCDAVVGAVRAARMEDRCVIQSTDYPTLKRIRALAPEIPIGAIVAAKVGRLPALDVDFFAVSPQQGTTVLVRAAHGRGKRVVVWTLNDRAAMERFVNRGVDGIMTDHPDRALALLADRSEIDEFYAALVRLFRR